MPELPEVEVVTRALGNLITGRRFVRAKLLRAGLVPDTSPGKFARLLRGARIEAVGRRGKHILLHLDNAQVLVTHLRMTGKFLYMPLAVGLPKHTHAFFDLDNNRRLAFSDQRHFALMKIVPAEKLYEAKELSGLAPEPFSEEFSPAYLYGVLNRSRRALKEILLDQRKVTGLGNIYAAEALFVARVNPFITAAKVSRTRAPRLYHAIREVLEEAIAHGSMMDVDPEDIESSYFGGSYEGGWRVYDREGEPCTVCGARIRRVSRGGRSTYFCPRCQRR